MADEPLARSRSTYHHGDLRRSLIEAAAAIIEGDGVDALTLRGVGERVGVSRTALYRHFADKTSLLAAVALAGFEMLHRDLEATMTVARAGGADPLAALAEAYVDFGTRHSPHYRTMFGPAVTDRHRYPALAATGQAAFGLLVAEITSAQRVGRVKPGDPIRLAQVFWSTVHGIVMLGGDDHFGFLPDDPADGPSLGALAATILGTGMVDPGSTGDSSHKPA